MSTIEDVQRQWADPTAVVRERTSEEIRQLFREGVPRERCASRVCTAKSRVYYGYTEEQALAEALDYATRCPECHSHGERLADAKMINKPDIFECAEHGMFEAGKLTRKRKICLKCGHPECPACGDWCDVMGGEHADEDSNACCDMECTYE